MGLDLPHVQDSFCWSLWSYTNVNILVMSQNPIHCLFPMHLLSGHLELLGCFNTALQGVCFKCSFRSCPEEFTLRTEFLLLFCWYYAVFLDVKPGRILGPRIPSGNCQTFTTSKIWSLMCSYITVLFCWPSKPIQEAVWWVVPWQPPSLPPTTPLPPVHSPAGPGHVGFNCTSVPVGGGTRVWTGVSLHVPASQYLPLVWSAIAQR